MRARGGTLLLAVVLVSAACGTEGQATLTVPAQDATPPEAVLDFLYPQGVFTMTSGAASPSPPPELAGNEEISLSAKCADIDGGCRNIAIDVDGLVTNADGTVVPVRNQPLKESLDPSANPGGTALRERLLTAKLDIPQLRGSGAGLRLAVTATATNAHGAIATTRRALLFWSRNVPLTLSPCPRFNPVGATPPTVLDSRLLTIRLLGLMNDNPTRTSFTIAILPPASPAGHTFRVDVTEGAPPPGGPTVAGFALTNSTGQTRRIAAVDSRNCGAVGQSLTAAPGATTSTMTVDITNTTSLYFTDGSQDFAIWNEIPFWQAFGGRTTTFGWLSGP